MGVINLINQSYITINAKKLHFMNKTQFIDFVAHVREKKKSEAEEAVNLVITSILKAISIGNSVNLVGFGSWSVKERPSRQGYNPKNGIAMQIPSYYQLVFKSGQKLKDACKLYKKNVKRKKKK